MVFIDGRGETAWPSGGPGWPHKVAKWPLHFLMLPLLCGQVGEVLVLVENISWMVQSKGGGDMEVMVVGPM